MTTIIRKQQPPKGLIHDIYIHHGGKTYNIYHPITTGYEDTVFLDVALRTKDLKTFEPIVDDVAYTFKEINVSKDLTDEDVMKIIKYYLIHNL